MRQCTSQTKMNNLLNENNNNNSDNTQQMRKIKTDEKQMREKKKSERETRDKKEKFEKKKCLRRVGCVLLLCVLHAFFIYTDQRTNTHTYHTPHTVAIVLRRNSSQFCVFFVTVLLRALTHTHTHRRSVVNILCVAKIHLATEYTLTHYSCCVHQNDTSI